MDDLISRQRLLKELKHHKELFCRNRIEFLGLSKNDKARVDEIDNCYAMVINAPSAQPERKHGRVFKEIVVKYLSYNTYPEYKGKPYFSIKYTENGQGFIGYGTYKPEVLSEYLKEYFMSSEQPERPKSRWVDSWRSKMDGTRYWYRECDHCGYERNDCDSEKDSNFCPNCGAKME